MLTQQELELKFGREKLEKGAAIRGVSYYYFIEQLLDTANAVMPEKPTAIDYLKFIEGLDKLNAKRS